MGAGNRRFKSYRSDSRFSHEESTFYCKRKLLNEDELSLVVKESTDLFQYLIDGKKTNPATLDGKILKQNMGIHYHDHYDNAHTSSDTVKIFNRKVFEDALYNEFEVEVLRDLCYNMDWNGMMLSYYKNGDHYKPHYDGSFITGLYWFDIKPRKFTGGELYLYNGTQRDNPQHVIPFQPKNNRFIAFPSCYMHEVKPVVISDELANQRSMVVSAYPCFVGTNLPNRHIMIV